MNRIIIPIFLGILMLGCSGKTEKGSEEPALDPELIEQEELIQDLEGATKEITEEADELAGEIDSLLNNL